MRDQLTFLKDSVVMRVERQDEWHKGRGIVVRMPEEMTRLRAEEFIYKKLKKENIALCDVGKVLLYRNGESRVFLRRKLSEAQV